MPTAPPFLHAQPGRGADPGHTLAVTAREAGLGEAGWEAGDRRLQKPPPPEASWWSWHEGRDLEEK